MHDDYLWDRSGEPDPEVERLEELLGRFRHHPLPRVRRPRRAPTMRTLALLAATVAVALLGLRLLVTGGGRRPGWEVAPLAGVVRLDEPGRLRVGGWLETGAGSRARIEVGTIGEVQVEPDTRLRLVRADDADHRLALDHGTIHARIWAPPRLFYVETRSAIAVDLGCEYTLTVDRTGAGFLRVTSGWVALEGGDRQALVPAGASCAVRPGRGPGTPAFDDAAAAFREALGRLDEAVDAGEPRAAALAVVLERASARDALTLWHLLPRLSPGERAPAYDRLSALAPPPVGVTREGVLRGDRTMHDRWWKALPR